MSRTTEQAARLIEAVAIAKARKEEFLKEHSKYDLKEEQVCPFCNNTGLQLRIYDIEGKEYPITEKNRAGMYEYYEPCGCIKREIPKGIKTDRNFANIPGLYRDAMFTNFSTEIYKDLEGNQLAAYAKSTSQFYVENFADMENKGIGLYIWSTSKGCGKSRLASTISNELTERGVRNKYASANTILSEIQESWNDKSKDEYKILKNYISPRLLIIDDYGARSGQSWMDEKFFIIFDKRYQDNKPTIVTSNYDINKLPIQDMRITDRLNDIDRFVNVKMPQKSIRTESRTASQSAFYEIYKNKKGG